MKLPVLIFSAFFFCQALNAQHAEPLYSGNHHQDSFESFAASVLAKTGKKIFFDPTWTSRITVTGRWENVPLTSVINDVIAGKGLFLFEDISGNILITRKFMIRKDYSDMIVAGPVISMKDTVIKEPVTVSRETSVMSFGLYSDRKKEGTVTLSGQVTNESTGEAIPGASILATDLGTGTMTNESGFYSLSLPRGTYKIEFRSLGSHDTYRNVNLYGNGQIDVALVEKVIAIKDAVITASHREKLERLESGMSKTNIMMIRLSPSSMGEADLIKSVLMMPGVKTVGEGSSGINVRGGASDQNLMLLYDAPLYNSSHFFGFFSSVNSEIINEISLYKGGMPAKYGGRISSVMDISARDGNKNSFNGNFGISPIASHLTIEGPLKKETSSFILAARTTYSNYLLSILPDAALRNSRASFYDVNGRIVSKIGKNQSCEFSVYHSHDDFRFNSDTTYGYDNFIISGRYKNTITSKLFAVFSLINSHYQYNVSADRNPLYSFTQAHAVNTSGARAYITWFPGANNELSFGTEVNFHIISPGVLAAGSDESVITAKDLGRERGLEPSVYGEYKADLYPWLSVRAGFRLSSLFTFGPSEIYLYDPLFSKERSTIIDTLFYRSGSITKAFIGPETRLSMNFRITPESSFKVNYNRTYQYLQLLSNTVSISPTDTWKMCGYHIKPQSGDQLSAGIYTAIRDFDYEVSLEGYYKAIRNMIDYKGGAQLTMNELIEADIINASARAYGVELTLKKNVGKLKAALNYTWSGTLLKSTGKFEEERINKGQFYPASYDRPHDFNLQLNCLYSRRLNWSVNIVYNTGRPVSYPVTFYPYNGVNILYYSERNKYRLPDYLRLDVSVNLYSNLKASRIFRPSWNFSVYNLLGRENIYTVFFRSENNKIQGYSLSIFARAIPTVSYRMDF